MKTTWQWVLTIVVYMLLYSGANDIILPALEHFHHNEWRMPSVIDGPISSGLLPLALAYLIAAISRRDSVGSSPWPFLFAPVILIAGAKYMAEAFYPPFLDEFLATAAVGGIQGLCACGGWFLYKLWSGRKGVRSKMNVELRTEPGV